MLLKSKCRNEKGSVTLEATVTFSLVLVLLFISVGTVFSVLLNERMNQMALMVTSDMQFYALSIYDGEDVIKTEISEVVLEQIIIEKLSHLMTEQGVSHYVHLDKLLTISDSQLQTDGVFSLNLYYRFKIPTILKTQVLSYPIVGVAHSDGVQFESNLTYITNTGVKYHRENCFHLRKSKIAIDIKNAEERGYEPCKNCYGNQ